MIHAAGGVLWRRVSGAGASPQIAVVHRPRYDDWSLPKGKLEPGEHPLLAAVREVGEETGLTVRVGRRLTTTEYAVNGEPKEVDYWAMRAVDGQFTAGDEVDELRWVQPAQAKQLLSSRQDAAVIDAMLSLPWDTTAVLLVRHGSAGDAEAWTGDDSLRPLDEIGRRQAQALAALLPAYRPTRVLSADRVRCVDTVRPAAELLGIGLEIDGDFSEDSHAQDPERMGVRLRALAATGDPVVVGSQGGVIPDTVTLLARHDGVSLSTDKARKGSLWALHFAVGCTLAAADYYAAPDRPIAPPAADATDGVAGAG